MLFIIISNTTMTQHLIQYLITRTCLLNLKGNTFKIIDLNIANKTIIKIFQYIFECYK